MNYVELIGAAILSSKVNTRSGNFSQIVSEQFDIKVDVLLQILIKVKNKLKKM